MTTLSRPTRLPARRGPRRGDRAFAAGTRWAGIAIVSLLVGIAIVLAVESWPAWRAFGTGLLTGTTWDPTRDIYGAVPFIVGTLATAFIAVVIAAPVGLLTAIYLAEFADRRLATPLTFTIELLAAIPSVVLGLWGIFVLAPLLRDTLDAFVIAALGWIPLFAGPSYGFGVSTAGVILAIMILPTIVSIGREVLRSVPAAQREAMYGLGATRWEVATRAVLPYARSGVVGAVILGLGRALGETLAVTMVIGNTDAIPTSVFSQGQSIASKIAVTFNESTGLQSESLVGLGLILLAMTLLLNAAARLLVARTARGPRR
ncbi:MAG: phosphate ABC transporter permease subunit PstC [Chloroflexi bacterium]|nr:phosphate ABC transporter permease subunit PstC [Chloroflexota bacterium]